jgi:hypothetical protein
MKIQSLHMQDKVFSIFGVEELRIEKYTDVLYLLGLWQVDVYKMQ